MRFGGAQNTFRRRGLLYQLDKGGYSFETCRPSNPDITFILSPLTFLVPWFVASERSAGWTDACAVHQGHHSCVPGVFQLPGGAWDPSDSQRRSGEGTRGYTGLFTCCKMRLYGLKFLFSDFNK